MRSPMLVASRMSLSIAALALLLPLLASADATASAPRLVVVSPEKSSTVSTKIPVRLRLVVGRDSRVRIVRFFVNGKLMGADRRAPFTTRSNASFDSGPSPARHQKLRISARYIVRRSHRRLVTGSAKKVVRVKTFRPPPLKRKAKLGGWPMTFGDDFSASTMYGSPWNTQREDWIKGGVPYNNLEGAGYLDSNVKIGHGTMSLSISHRKAAGQPMSTASVNTHHRFDFKYGYLEARIRVPKCSGCWPAFWLLPSRDTWPPEIDIFEFFNTAINPHPYAALHWPAKIKAKQRYRSNRLSKSPRDSYVGTWHTYGMLWTAQQVQFYVDGVARAQHSNAGHIPHEAMYPIIQLAVGKHRRPKAGSALQVDHVRVWEPRR